LPAGRVKGAVLAMLVRAYGDVDTLHFVIAELGRNDLRLPPDDFDALQKMLAEPAVLYRLGRKDEVLASAQKNTNFAPRAEIIRLLILEGDADTAAAIFELLSDTPPRFGEDCYGWFSIGGLELWEVGNARAPAPALGTFLDRLPASPLFKRICPTGLDAELAVQHLLAAGRFEAAIVLARQERTTPFLLIDTLLQIGTTRLQSGDRDAARAHAEEAAAVLPPFDPGDPIKPSNANRTEDSMARATTDLASTDLPQRSLGERSGDTGRRFEVIRLLAATGAVTEADALARKQQGPLLAVALSAAVAGRAGLRFDDQAPSLSVISATEL
jgi:tetratricopeptide (TPR) repeat protein